MVANYTSDELLTLIDGASIAAYGAKIVKSSGFWDAPKPKEHISYRWGDRDGIEVDLGSRYFDARYPRMEIVVDGNTLQEMKNNVDMLMSVFRQTGLRHLKFPGVAGVHMVYASEDIQISRRTKGIGQRQLALVDFRFTEPHPLNRQFVANQTGGLVQVSMAVTVSGPVRIEWGDNTGTDVSESGTVTHDYTTANVFCVVVHPLSQIEGIGTLVNLVEI